jgi:hypothetical protein
MSDTDPTAPWFEFLSYIRCCESLGVTPSMNRFLAYNQYFRSVIDEKQKTSQSKTTK